MIFFFLSLGPRRKHCLSFSSTKLLCLFWAGVKIRIDRRKGREKGTDKAVRGKGGKVRQGRESILMGSSTLNVLGPLRMSRDNGHDEYTFPKEGKAGNPGCEFISPIGILEDME